MTYSIITIPPDPQTAQAYDSAAPEQKRKIQALLSLWLRELVSATIHRCSKCSMKWVAKQEIGDLHQKFWTPY
jgi:hypothetical protein